MSGWTAATRCSGDRVMMLLQGHPEYDPTTLLREFRRDSLRYLADRRQRRPSIPEHYLDPVGEELLEDFMAGGRAAADFPFTETAARIRTDWAVPARALFANWVADATSRSALVAS
jgi:homoserine O-succinyltransferase